MQAKLFRLGSNDLVKGLITAVLAGVGLAIASVIQGVFTPGFDAFSTDWVLVLHNVVNAAITGAEAGFVGYIGKNFFTDSNGAIFGVIGGNKTP